MASSPIGWDNKKAWSPNMTRDTNLSQFSPVDPQTSREKLMDTLNKIADCLWMNNVPGHPCDDIRNKINELIRATPELSKISLPTRDQFFAALQSFCYTNRLDNLRDLDPLGRSFPICLFMDQKKEFAVVLLVTFRAPTWVSSDVNDAFWGPTTLHSESQTFEVYSIKQDATPWEKVPLREVLPLGEIHVMPSTQWYEILDMIEEDQSYLDVLGKWRTNFYAVLGDLSRWPQNSGLSPKHIHAVYNYFPQDKPLETFKDPIEWDNQDLLLTLLRGESALTSIMINSGKLDPFGPTQFDFDFMTLLPASGEVKFETVRNFIMNRGQWAQPVLAPRAAVQAKAWEEDKDKDEAEKYPATTQRINYGWCVGTPALLPDSPVQAASQSMEEMGSNTSLRESQGLAETCSLHSYLGDPSLPGSHTAVNEVAAGREASQGAGVAPSQCQGGWGWPQVIRAYDEEQSVLCDSLSSRAGPPASNGWAN